MRIGLYFPVQTTENAFLKLLIVKPKEHVLLDNHEKSVELLTLDCLERGRVVDPLEHQDLPVDVLEEVEIFVVDIQNFVFLDHLGRSGAQRALRQDELLAPLENSDEALGEKKRDTIYPRSKFFFFFSSSTCLISS